MLTPDQVKELDARLGAQSTEEMLHWAWHTFGKKAAIGTSFQGAGLVMMHIARERGYDFPIFTLDTGLLFPETVALKERLETFLGKKIERLEPDLTVEQQNAAVGPDLWKTNPDLCCSMRKVVPLQGKLAELDCWITGLRRQQAATRADIGVIEIYAFDPASGRDIIKMNPMANWTREAVWDYIRKHQIPYNPLHDQGYRSIGCAPCTSKAGKGEDERGGRWIGFNKVECGIHTFMSRKA